MKELIEKIKKKFNSLTNKELKEITILLYDSFFFEAQHILMKDISCRIPNFD